VRRVLVTGATGLIGEVLLQRMSGEFEVLALSRTPPVDLPGIEWIECDLAKGSIPISPPSRLDAVIHLAQSERYRDFPQAAAEIWNVSAGVTLPLLDLALRSSATHFILASTGGLYTPRERPISEADPADNDGGELGFYYAAKRASEALAKGYGGLLVCATLRFFFVYGPGQRSSMLIPRLVETVRGGQPVLLAGDGGLRLNPIHVDDAVGAIIASLNLSASSLINVAGPEVVSMRQIAETIGRLVDRAPDFQKTQAIRPADFVADVTRMRRLLVAPTVRLAQGFADLVSG
jgi:UDP-glucose 4-epimerase